MGYLHFTGKRGRVGFISHDILGMSVAEVRLPGTDESRFARRRTLKALDRLDRAGCRRLLLPCPLLPQYPAVHTRSLWQAMAAPLAVTCLRREGMEPRRSVVALQADRMTRGLYRTCLTLAETVGALSLNLRQDDGLVWRLQRELGLPLVDRPGNVTLSFFPGVASPRFFPLGSLDPEIPGYRLNLPGLSLPEDCPHMPVLSALLDEGRLPLHTLLIETDNP